MSRLLKMLRPARFVEFTALFAEHADVAHLVVTFLAMLELAREQLISIAQAEPYAPIYAQLRGEARIRTRRRVRMTLMTTDTTPPSDLADAKAVLEAALLVAGEPVPPAQLAKLFEPALPLDTVRALLDELAREWSTRKVELVQVASGWRFQGRARSAAPISIGWRRRSRRAIRVR